MSWRSPRLQIYFRFCAEKVEQPSCKKKKNHPEIKCHFWISAEPTQSLLPVTQIHNSSRQPWNIPHAACRMSGCPFTFQAENNLWPSMPFSCSADHIQSKSFDCRTLSPPPAVIQWPLWPRLFLEVKSLIWDGDYATGFPCAPEFQRLPRRQLGVRGHGNPLPRDSWENQELDGSPASLCWQSALGLVRHLWVKKKKVSRVRSTKSARGILAAPFRPLNTSTSQP